MGIAVNSGSSAASAVGAVNVSSNRVAARMRAAKDNKNKKPKKKLNYNPREISSQLARAQKARNANIVLIRAKMKLSVLHSAHASGQYDESEVRIAMAHAKRMVECSRIKVRNLKEEEVLKNRNDKASNTHEIRKKSEIKRRVRQKEQALEAKVDMEETKEALDEKLRQQILRQKRRMHRNDEQRRIAEADLKYMEDQIKNNQENNSTRYEGVSLDLSGEASQMAELKMMEQQIEQQVELEVELQYAAMDSGSMAGASSADLSASIDIGGAQMPTAVDMMV